MAEFVELKAEEWATQLHYLKKIRLFQPKEINAIITKRKCIEYKLRRKVKTSEDYLSCIQFEINLLRLIQFRRNKMNIQSHTAVIEGYQNNRILSLFKKVVLKNQGDIKLWMSFFKYCSETNMLKIGNQMLTRMLQVHANQENMWCFAAKWGHETLKSAHTARQFLLKGMRHHPKSVLLHTELFKLELNYAMDKKKEIEEGSLKTEESDDQNLDVVNLKLAQVVYENSRTIIKDVNFKVSLLNLASEYPDTENLQNEIFEDMMKEHREDDASWDLLARRRYQGIDYLDPLEEGRTKIRKLDDEKKRLYAAINTYKAAVKRHNTMRMWGLYLDFLFEIKGQEPFANLKNGKLRQALKGALSARRLEEKNFIRWAELFPQIFTNPLKQAKILKRATIRYPQSLELWQLRLKHHLLRDQEKNGMKVLLGATEKITGAQSFPLWKLMIHYCQTKSYVMVEELFRTGIARGGPLSLRLKPLYLHWLALTKGVGYAKSLFESPEMHHPPCVEIIHEMISLEMMQPDVNKKFIRRCHEMACSLSGKDNLDVWISYIEFELTFGDGEGPFIIYLRAVKALNPELVDEFVSRYNALKMDD